MRKCRHLPVRKPEWRRILEEKRRKHLREKLQKMLVLNEKLPSEAYGR
jgi:hypothetical protein